MKRKGCKIRRGLLCLLLAACLGLLGGCRDDMEIKLTTGLNVGELFRIDNKSCTHSEARLFLMNQKNRYEASYGPNIWAVPVGDEDFADYMKTELHDFLVRLKTMALMAEKQGLALSEDEEGRAVAAATEYTEGLSPEAAEYIKMTQEQVTNLYREYRLAELLVRQLTEGVNEEISDDAARVIEVQQVVLIKEGQPEAQREKAEQVAALAAQGEVFVNLQEVYSDEEAGNLRVSRYDVQPEWEKAVFSLASGEVSDVIETPEAFYVVRCINNMLETETQANKDVIRERQKAEAFFEAYEAFAVNLPSIWDEEGWKQIRFTGEIPECPVDFYRIYETHFG